MFKVVTYGLYDVVRRWIYGKTFYLDLPSLISDSEDKYFPFDSYTTTILISSSRKVRLVSFGKQMEVTTQY